MRKIVVLPLLALVVAPAVQADPLDTPFRDGPEFQVNTNTTGTQSAPGVAISDDGRFVVVWHGQGSNDTGLFMQRFDHNGMPQGGETRVNEDPSGGPSGPEVAMNDSGFVVVWRGAYPPHDFEAVVARRFDAGGTPLGGDFQVNTYTTECQSESSVAMDDAGNFVIVWSSRSQDGSGTESASRVANNSARDSRAPSRRKS